VHTNHVQGAPPSYFIVAGLVFTPATVPYLRSEYGKEYDYDAPVSDRLLRQGLEFTLNPKPLSQTHDELTLNPLSQTHDGAGECMRA
jgi:hypothetical protein